MSRYVGLLIAMAWLTAACGPSADVEQERNALMELDRQWSESVGDVETFVSFYSPDATMYPQGMPAVTGAEALREMFTQMHAMPDFGLQFSPTKAEVSAAGDLGYTTGTFEFSSSDALGNPLVEKGKYVAVWEKQPDGAWKVVEDIFNADGAPPESPKHLTQNARGITWGDVPPGLPAGAKIAVMSGTPFQAGPFVVRLQAPAGYRIAPHWHPTAEHVTVISGTLAIGMGETFNEAAMQDLTPGGYTLLPAEMRHYAMAKTATTIQIHGTGPFAINYVNPADDPRQQQ